MTAACYDCLHKLQAAPQAAKMCQSFVLQFNNLYVDAGDSYLLHISSTTGATVTLRGRGSGMYDR